MLGIVGSIIGVCWVAALILLTRAGIRRLRHQQTSAEIRLARLAATTAVAASLITITASRI
ncbi:MAG: hypothetical protein ACLP50_30940 [Solirubrobacteraceae bacterium]